jgi:hypothetical protein
VARRIGANGVISIAWQQISIGKHKAGLDVDVLVTDSMVHIYYKEELLKTALRSNSKEVRKKRASVLKITSWPHTISLESVKHQPKRKCQWSGGVIQRLCDSVSRIKPFLREEIFGNGKIRPMLPL